MNIEYFSDALCVWAYAAQPRLNQLHHDFPGQINLQYRLDLETKDQYQVNGSPTLVFNEGRQKLYGNVGYRIIKANVQELFHNLQHGEANWC